MSDTTRMIRVAFFIDGGFFNEVCRYYKFQHSRQARLAFDGVQNLTRRLVAEREKVDEALVQVVEAHYFRGRMGAADTEAAGKLKDQARFDDVLIRAGIVTHYTPMTKTPEGRPKERGVNVSLALEAYGLAVHKGFEVFVLFAGDQDQVPLVRKLNSLGIRTLLLGWDLEYTYEREPAVPKRKEIRTAQALMDVSTYTVMMPALIDDRSRREDPLIMALFVPPVGPAHAA